MNELGKQESIGRFWSKVDTSGGPNACWPWTGGLCAANYGRFSSPYWPTASAHRVAFMMTNGPITPKYEVDHLCHTVSDCAEGDDCLHRRCCNPAHLRELDVAAHRALPRRTNKPRKKFVRPELCRHGHPWAENKVRNTQGRLVCKECGREASRRQDVKRKAARAVAAGRPQEYWRAPRSTPPRRGKGLLASLPPMDTPTHGHHAKLV